MKTLKYRWSMFLAVIITISTMLSCSVNKQDVVEVSAWLKASSQAYHDTIVWLSDTQYYSESYPHIFQNQIDWMLSNRSNWNIQYVIHTGDIVNKADEKIQWLRAHTILKQLDKQKMPYGVLAGNHDLIKNKSYEPFSFYFGEKRFRGKEYYGGSYKNNRGHYDLIKLGDTPFIILYMGWGVGSDEIDWMNQVLKAFPERMAILAFHKYLHKNKRRTFEGRKIFHEVVKRNENVKVVLSGHYDDSEHIVTEIDDDQDGTPDRKVYEILADYQGAPEGGQGFLRLLHYYPDRSKIYVRTYSPYLDKYYYYSPFKHPGKDEFWIDL
ncbi:metallophosphoesterase [Bacillus sp. FJAT-47783]|uniref:metallophosphoesterase n=1 Tax=Bacillus sp. FJAT-47783 TaxID=2922712 RepID=UPI001FAC791D|nr:metallophosphoesterase [Bacillus sp. FJAT-47783]